MLNISYKKLLSLKEKFRNKRIAVIGDMMLDSYYKGKVSRISPEAPVPVVEVDNEFSRFGGALNVAYNILTLGGTPLPIGIIGNDAEGKLLKKLMRDTGITDEAIFIDKSRPTTSKTRVIAHSQQVVRVDKESTAPLSKSMEKKIIDYLKHDFSNIDAIILQDYNKGVLTRNLIKEVISKANEENKIITVDPKFNNFFEYKNVTVFKPNRKETEDALSMKLQSDDDISKAGEKLLHNLNARYILLTLGEAGIALFEKGKPEKRVPTKARKVADVSGAGDTVISTITIALAAGVDIYNAAYLANYAGGIVCQEVGIVPINIDDLINAVKEELKK
ncbi:D-glycero-beta-D-manno-heptose-7-phosphate kinase [Melioribacter sp. Ez-97]|jgi:rfaE bifunctional protein kinase chain/domain|uniref:D-glycero-beta-D-manno-heptose-7-phosphate kinase n=1 Tax=Melioribacter sp. Ez-97 TaxID=3423434 RepID=UPI003ED9C5C6